MESNVWNMMRTIFNVKEVSKANYFNIMSYINDEGLYSLYIVEMNNNFEIAPDILIMKDSKSILGGMFGSSRERIERIPHAMTPEDLQQMLDYFDIIAFDRFIKLFD